MKGNFPQAKGTVRKRAVLEIVQGTPGRATRELGIALIVLSAVLGAILGSTIGFWIGGRYGYPLLLRYGSYIGLTEIRIKIARYLFRRQGMVVVLIARFVAVLRSVVGFIAGANQMAFANFMIANSGGRWPGHCSTGLAHIISAKVSRSAAGRPRI